MASIWNCPHSYLEINDLELEELEFLFCYCITQTKLMIYDSSHVISPCKIKLMQHTFHVHCYQDNHFLPLLAFIQL